MAVSPARAAAFDILIRVEQEEAYASELLHSRRCEELSPADHGLTTELVMGVLRWRSWLDSLISHYSSIGLAKLDQEVLVALRLAAYQMAVLERVPKRAAVHESVELVKRARKRSAAPFTNAVLRKLSAARLRPPEHSFEGNEVQTLAETTAHALWLVEQWTKEFGLDTARRICAHNQRSPETSIHIFDRSAIDELTREGITLGPGILLRSAQRVLSGRLVATRAFREGRVFVQDEASQLVALLIGNAFNILDCCAAPGGKTRLLAERNPDAKILAVELHAHRARLLRKRVSVPNVHVVNADIRELAVSQLFDRVLVDAPCSATGTLSHHPEIKWRLKPEDLADLRSRQAAILQAAMRHVAPKGMLIYSTCSLEREENEEVVDSALNGQASFRVVDCSRELDQLRSQGELVWPEPASLTCGPFLRTIPGIHNCDGFFAAILQKK
ncbi:MAG TPA: 16S rRNA (cytosine(967)-C(5))-methyltransferase RsmB [Terriglobales bacterium]|nr:16S rRNA (cytosine(967)-C(5))-methyltransferase RsmB [Terriglobales bacterium]